MKKWLLILILSLFPLSVLAENKDIIIRYKKIINGITYVDEITDSSSHIIIGDKNIVINTAHSLNGAEVALIKVSGEAYDWLSSINGENNYYYFGIISNDEFIETDKIKSILINDSLIKIYDLNGNIIKQENENIEYNNSNFYFSYEDIKEEQSEVSLNIKGEGLVIINEKIYDRSQNIEVDEHSKIMIMSSENYNFKDFLLNNESIYGNFSDNILSYDLKKGDKLEVTFEKKDAGNSENNEQVSISGYISKKGINLQNAKIILHGDKEYTTTTDNNGYYEFNNIPVGDYEILIISDDKNVGYKKFTVGLDSKADVSVDDSNQTIVNINLLEDYDLSFSVSKVIDEKESQNYFSIVIISGIILISLIFIIILIIKKYKEEKM